MAEEDSAAGDAADSVAKSAPGAGTTGRRRPRKPRRQGPRRWARGMFYTHLWGGVAATGILVVVSVTGILLNHKRGLDLMPDVDHQPSGEFRDALPLATLAAAATAAAPPDAAAAGVDRMDVRPDDGLVKVRFDDPRVIEVTVDLHTGEVLHVGERNDVFIEKMHSGEIFGDLWILLSDAAAIFILAALVTGCWLWLYPRRHL